MNFARGDAEELAAVKALASQAQGCAARLIPLESGTLCCGLRLARWRINAPELQAKIQQQAPVIDAPLTEWLSHKPTFASLRRGAKLSFGNAGACC